MKQFIIEQNKGKLRITPLNTVAKPKTIIIKDDPTMGLKELKKQIADNYSVEIDDIDLLIF